MRSINTRSANRRTPGLVIALFVVLVALIGFGGVLLASGSSQTITPLAAQTVPGDADAPASVIDMVWSATNPTISGIGNTVTLDINMVAGTQAMRAFAIYLNFPQTILNAVDFDASDPDYDIDVNLTDFPSVLVSRINNTLGRIDAASGRTTGTRSGTRRLISVTFRGMACGQALVSFAFEPDNVRVTDILLDPEISLLGSTPSNTITVTDPSCPATAVPSTATNTPTNTATTVPSTATSTPTNTATTVPSTATSTPTNTATTVPSTATSTPTNTATTVPSTATSTPTNTATTVPSTATSTPTNTATTVPSTATSTPTNTATTVPSTATSTPTNTATTVPSTATSTPTNTATTVPIMTNTPLPTSTATNVPIATNTPLPTATATDIVPTATATEVTPTDIPPTVDPSQPTATPPPVVPPPPAATPVPAAFVSCENLGRRTDGNMTAAGSQGIVTAGGTQRGDAFCRIIAVNGGYVTSPQEVGDRNVVSRGVVNSVDIFGLMPNGARGFNIFVSVMQVCVRSVPNTVLLFADALGAPRLFFPADTFTSGDYTCTYVGRDGTIAQVRN